MPLESATVHMNPMLNTAMKASMSIGRKKQILNSWYMRKEYCITIKLFKTAQVTRMVWFFDSGTPGSNQIESLRFTPIAYLTNCYSTEKQMHQIDVAEIVGFTFVLCKTVPKCSKYLHTSSNWCFPCTWKYNTAIGQHLRCRFFGDSSWSESIEVQLIMYVLEMPHNWFRKKVSQLGDRVSETFNFIIVMRKKTFSSETTARVIFSLFIIVFFTL